MKKSLLITLFIFIVTNTYSQFLCKNVDEFKGSTSYLVDRLFVEVDDNSNLVSILPFFKEVEGKVYFTEIIIKVKGLECIDTESEIILIFENEEKTTLTNWNKFNCNDVMYCSMSVKAKELFTTQKLTKFKIINKRNYKSSTVLDVKYNKSYFRDIYGYLNLIDNDASKIEVCKKK
jgi:hypothetical protein